MPNLSSRQLRFLRAKAHELKPVVRVGQHGLRDSVIAEVETALTAHELIKAKISADRDGRAAIAAQLCAATNAILVQTVGQVATLYRANPERPRIELPPAD